MNTEFVTELVNALLSLKKKPVALAFLQNLLKPAELDEIAVRLQIVKLLKKGVAQRKVAEKLRVSIGTVSRGSRELKYGVAGFNQVL